jgi:hypothetical protein
MQTILIISAVLAVPGWVAYLLVSRRRCIWVLESRYSPEGAFGPLKEAVCYLHRAAGACGMSGNYERLIA